MKRLVASFTSACYRCTLPTSPGERIVQLMCGRSGYPGLYCHEGCWDWPDWRDDQQRNPCLTDTQVANLLKAMQGSTVPADDVQVQRFLGALRTARKERRTFIHTVDVVRLVMGVDLYEGYQKVLRALAGKRTIGPWWTPVHPNGQPWSQEPDRAPVPEPARTLSPASRFTLAMNGPSGPRQAPVVERLDAPVSAYRVIGRIIRRVILEGYASAGQLASIRDPNSSGPYELIPSYQVHDTYDDAQSDVARFMLRSAVAGR